MTASILPLASQPFYTEGLAPAILAIPDDSQGILDLEERSPQTITILRHAFENVLKGTGTDGVENLPFLVSKIFTVTDALSQTRRKWGEGRLYEKEDLTCEALLALEQRRVGASIEMQSRIEGVMEKMLTDFFSETVDGEKKLSPDKVANFISFHADFAGSEFLQPSLNIKKVMALVSLIEKVLPYLDLENVSEPLRRGMKYELARLILTLFCEKLNGRDAAQVTLFTKKLGLFTSQGEAGAPEKPILTAEDLRYAFYLGAEAITSSPISAFYLRAYHQMLQSAQINRNINLENEFIEKLPVQFLEVREDFIFKKISSGPGFSESTREDWKQLTLLKESLAKNEKGKEALLNFLSGVYNAKLEKINQVYRKKVEKAFTETGIHVNDLDSENRIFKNFLKNFSELFLTNFSSEELSSFLEALIDVGFSKEEMSALLKPLRVEQHLALFETSHLQAIGAEQEMYRVHSMAGNLLFGDTDPYPFNAVLEKLTQTFQQHFGVIADITNEKEEEAAEVLLGATALFQGLRYSTNYGEALNSVAPKAKWLEAVKELRQNEHLIHDRIFNRRTSSWWSSDFERLMPELHRVALTAVLPWWQARLIKPASPQWMARFKARPFANHPMHALSTSQLLRG